MAPFFSDLLNAQQRERRALGDAKQGGDELSIHGQREEAGKAVVAVGDRHFAVEGGDSGRLSQ
jgi:hypothetical protein